MYTYTQKTVKGIGNERPRSLLGTSRDAERGDLTDLLGKHRIARHDRGRVGLQLSISDHVSGRYTHYVGGFGLRIASQDKADQYLLVYSPLASLNYGVGA